MKAKIYQARPAFRRRYTLHQISLLAEAGEAAKLPFNDRREMRIMLNNNIEAKLYHSRNMPLSLEQRLAHLAEANHMKSILKKIPS